MTCLASPFNQATLIKASYVQFHSGAKSHPSPCAVATSLQSLRHSVSVSPARRSPVVLSLYAISHNHCGFKPRSTTLLRFRHPKKASAKRGLLACAVNESNHSSSAEIVAVTQPVSKYDVDKELWEALDLCEDEELELLYNILHAASPFSPVVKSLVGEKEPALVELRGRSSIMHKVEARFRFLASDAITLLRGRRPAYRETLLAIRDRLDVQCPSTLSTPDLEAEVFIHVLQNCSEYVSAMGDPDPSEAASTAHASNDGDGMATMPPRPSPNSGNWTERLTAPLKFGARDLLPALLKLGSAATVTAMGTRAAERLGTKLVMQHVQYQAVVRTVTCTARSSLANWQRQAALQAAQKSLTTAATRYSALRGALSFLGPLMWGSLALELALASVGTDYARVIRAVFIVAQIRLVRTGGFVAPEQAIQPSDDFNSS